MQSAFPIDPSDPAESTPARRVASVPAPPTPARAQLPLLGSRPLALTLLVAIGITLIGMAWLATRPPAVARPTEITVARQATVATVAPTPPPVAPPVPFDAAYNVDPRWLTSLGDTAQGKAVVIHGEVLQVRPGQAPSAGPLVLLSAQIDNQAIADEPVWIAFTAPHPGLLRGDCIEVAGRSLGAPGGTSLLRGDDYRSWWARKQTGPGCLRLN